MTHELALAKSEKILTYKKTLIRLYHELVEARLSAEKSEKVVLFFLHISQDP